MGGMSIGPTQSAGLVLERIDKSGKKGETTVLKDPVCGKRINRGKAHIVMEYEGVDYFLCCPRCQAEFERAPRSYAKPELGEKSKKISQSPHIEHRPV